MASNQRETELASAVREVARALGTHVDGKLRTCLTCANFDEPSEVCRLAGQRPPARVVAYGCPAHAPEVPF
jgi:hypothetical protein